MKQLIIGFLIGVACSVAVFIPVLSFEKNAKFEFGKHTGFTNALHFSLSELKQEFGIIASSEVSKRLYSVKTSDVVVVEIDGVKTVRIVE